MISDEAVEVLASRDWAKDAERSEHEFPSWEEAARDKEWAGLVKEYRDDARAALEAAAPYIAAQALTDAVDAFPLETIVAPDNAVVWMMRRAAELRTNPYRSQA